MKIKCLNCGCVNLVETTLKTKGGQHYSGLEETFDFPSDIVVAGNKGFDATAEIKVYICPKCGHVELYSTYPSAKKEFDEKRQQTIAEANEKKRKAKIADLNKQIDNCKSIINNENYTVKKVNEAKAKLVDLEKQLKSL